MLIKIVEDKLNILKDSRGIRIQNDKVAFLYVSLGNNNNNNNSNNNNNKNKIILEYCHSKGYIKKINV